jgi:O-antigen/teichoic acid export membrane protein
MSEATAEKPPGRFGAAVAKLTGVNMFVYSLAFITSPILARALGPSGRGQIAAIGAIVVMAPWITELGMTAYLAREHARRTYPLGRLLGSTMPVIVGTSLIGVALAVPLAHAMGRGRHNVIEFVEIGLFILPAGVFLQALQGVTIADQRWGVMITAKLLNTGGAAVAIVLLAALDMLTVKSVAIIYLVASMIAGLPFLTALRGSRPWRFSASITRTGTVFGVRSWLSTIANVGNAQLDQLLMAGLVTSRQLGLYALAVTMSTATNVLIGATSNALLSRVAVGDSELAGRSARVALLIVAAAALAIGAASPVAIPLIFGSRFDGSIPMLIILLPASLFNVPSVVLGSALVAAGDPSSTARGQLAGLIVTVPALIVVLPIAAGIGAAWVSLVAYFVTSVIIVRAARRKFELSYRTLLVPTGADVQWLLSRVSHRTSRAA